MTARTKLNQKYFGDRTALNTELNSLREQSILYNKPKAVPTPAKRTSLVTKGLKLGGAAVGLALKHPIITAGVAGAGYLANSISIKNSETPDFGQIRNDGDIIRSMGYYHTKGDN